MKIPTMAVVIMIVVVSVIVVSVASILSPRFQGIQTTTTTETAQFHPTVPWTTSKYTGLSYLVVPNQCSGPAGQGACFTDNFSDAFIFTCLKEAATPQGCTVRINSTTKYWEYNTVTVWYPYHNQTGGGPSWSNCSFDWPGGNPNRLLVDLPSYCVPIGANGFILIRAPPVPP